MHFCSPFLSTAIHLSASTLLTINSTVNRLAQMERNGEVVNACVRRGGTTGVWAVSTVGGCEEE